jgi:death-on-curing protein
LELIVGRFIREIENTAVDVADNAIDKDLLYNIISSFTYENEFSEDLKFKIINAKLLRFDF